MQVINHYHKNDHAILASRKQTKDEGMPRLHSALPPALILMNANTTLLCLSPPRQLVCVLHPCTILLSVLHPCTILKRGRSRFQRRVGVKEGLIV